MSLVEEEEPTEWVWVEIQRHIECGAPGTPHQEDAYHPSGHLVTEKVRMRWLPDEVPTKSKGRHRA